MMPPPSPEQRRTTRRVESAIRMMAPALDVMLAVGDRVSRLVGHDDIDYQPPRVRREESPPPGS